MSEVIKITACSHSIYLGYWLKLFYETIMILRIPAGVMNTKS